MSAEAANETRAPKIKGLPLVGGLFELQRDPIAFFSRAAKLGDVVEIPLPYYRCFLINRPELVDHVLHERYREYSKQTRGYAALRTILGNGLLTSEGSFWLRQRRLAQPAFHKEKLDAWAQIMVRDTRELVEAWRPLAQSGEAFDVHEQMMRLTLRIVGEALLSTDLTSAASEVGPAMTQILRLLADRTARLLDFPDWVPTPSHRRLFSERARLDAIVARLISARRAAGAGDDLLGMLMSATDADTGERMDDQQLRDEVMTIMAAGHETTATALSWTFLLLSKAPEVEQRLREELDAVLRGREPTAADAPKLLYTSAVLHEALRLYPPVWMLARISEKEDVLGGVKIPKHTLVFFLPYLLHRRPDLWPEPEKFDPSRWLPDAVRPKSRCAFIPFSSGPRKCIGDGFALLEGQLVLATLLQRARLKIDRSHPFEPEPVITLRPLYGVKVRAELT
jgi:cytochrome P450